MAEINIQRKSSSAVWWILGIVAFALVVWWVLAAWDREPRVTALPAAGAPVVAVVVTETLSATIPS